MRRAALVLAACASTALFAQGLIEWSPARRLARRDFRGPVPPGAPGASMSWLHIETEWECRSGRLVASARALFDPERSWWRSGSRDAAGDRQLLEHEQLHFDIAEVAARKVRIAFDGLAGACREPGDTDGIPAMIAAVDRELQDDQQRYDRDTRHGIDARQQDRWRERIRDRLDPPPAPPSRQRTPAPLRRR